MFACALFRARPSPRLAGDWRTGFENCRSPRIRSLTLHGGSAKTTIQNSADWNWKSPASSRHLTPAQPLRKFTGAASTWHGQRLTVESEDISVTTEHRGPNDRVFSHSSRNTQRRRTARHGRVLARLQLSVRRYDLSLRQSSAARASETGAH